jgi:hypothetical protein
LSQDLGFRCFKESGAVELLGTVVKVGFLGMSRVQPAGQPAGDKKPHRPSTNCHADLSFTCSGDYIGLGSGYSAAM